MDLKMVSKTTLKPTGESQLREKLYEADSTISAKFQAGRKENLGIIPQK